MTKRETLPVDFTNNIGQVISPGDEVVIVTTGYSHCVNTNKGIYIGRRENGSVQCVKKVKTSYYVFKSNGERTPNSFLAELNKSVSEFIQEYKKSNPGKYDHYNQPEYEQIRKSYMDQLELKSEYVNRSTTLQRNRVYKLAA